ncbi:MAG: hypothetical protein M3Y42_06960 [Actinomycetota bacterium]|nr:hypothetical protein [Actinomycetota bacterium]MDQ2956685.1 hypothetical protein [Actinomycetota bacterium]
MSLKAKLRALFSIRVADISGVGSAAATAAPADGLHAPHPTTNSLIEPPADEPEQR